MGVPFHSDVSAPDRAPAEPASSDRRARESVLVQSEAQVAQRDEVSTQQSSPEATSSLATAVETTPSHSRLPESRIETSFRAASLQPTRCGGLLFPLAILNRLGWLDQDEESQEALLPLVLARMARSAARSRTIRYAPFSRPSRKTQRPPIGTVTRAAGAASVHTCF